MADVIKVGFGSTPLSILSPGTDDVIAQYIVSQPRHTVRIRSVRPIAMPTIGALGASNYIPLSIIRCSASTPTGKRPFSPSGLVPGLPQASDVSQYELMYQDLIRVQDPGSPIVFTSNDMYAEDGAMLCVVVGNVIDATLAPPGFAVGAAFAQALSVRGDDIFASGNETESQFPIGHGQGVGRSLPKWDIGNGE